MSEDVTVTLEAAVVRLSALEVRSLLRMQQQTRRWGELQAANPWAYNIWETGSKVGALQAPASAVSPTSCLCPGGQCCIADQPANAVAGSARPWWEILLSQCWARASPPTAGLHPQMAIHRGILVMATNVSMFNSSAQCIVCSSSSLGGRLRPVAGAQKCQMHIDCSAARCMCLSAVHTALLLRPAQLDQHGPVWAAPCLPALWCMLSRIC